MGAFAKLKNDGPAAFSRMFVPARMPERAGRTVYAHELLGLCALPPTQPTAQIVAAPSAAVKSGIRAAAGELTIDLKAGVRGVMRHG